MKDKVLFYVEKLLKNDTTGHNIDHILRVYNLSLKFAENKKVNKDIIVLASLLHDVDDYKLFDEKSNNAKIIMNNLKISNRKQKEVLNIINSMGYKNYLRGIRPKTIEGMIVSDADMCDAIGSIGIIRSITYALSNKGNKIIFDKNIFPNTKINYLEYNNLGTTHDTDSAINHFFEKLLKIPYILLTSEGKLEGFRRNRIMVEFLREYFIELNHLEWVKFLDNYIINIDKYL